MSVTENIVPDWVWKRRYSARLNKTATIVLGLFFGTLALVIVVTSFYVRSDIENVCTTSYLACSNLYSPGTPLGNVLSLLSFGVTAPAAGVATGSLAYGISTWRLKQSEWAATFSVQPFARHLQQWYSEGKLTRQQAEELFADMTASLRK